jgi:hypothetical protein
MSLESFKAFSLAGAGIESETDVSFLGTDFQSGEILMGGVVNGLSKGMEIWRGLYEPLPNVSRVGGFKSCCVVRVQE